MEILRQLGQIIQSQDDLLNIVQSVAEQIPDHAIDLSLDRRGQLHDQATDQERTSNAVSWDASRHVYTDVSDATARPLSGVPESASTTPTASASVAAARWFGLLSNDAAGGVLPEAEIPLVLDGGLHDSVLNQHDADLTPLQRATRIVDSVQLPEHGQETRLIPSHPVTTAAEKSFWQAPENISLLDQEQLFFQTFLHRICSWVRHTRYCNSIQWCWY